MNIKHSLDEKFGDNLNGRGHWEEVQCIRDGLLDEFPISFEFKLNKKQFMLKFMQQNSKRRLIDFPVYILCYFSLKPANNVSFEKVLSCNDDGIFPHDNPCVLILKDDHF